MNIKSQLLSEIVSMAVDQQEINAFYAKVNSGTAPPTWSAEEIASIYDQPFKQIQLGNDPTVSELLKVIPQLETREFGGYLSNGVLNYLKCDAAEALIPDKMFTFHTHPIGKPLSDMPSESDLHSFIYKARNLSLTVGSHKCWFFIKTRETMKKVAHYFRWRDEQMISMIQKLTQHELKDDLKTIMLKKVFDFELPDNFCELQKLDWLSLAEEKLGIKVLLFDKNDAEQKGTCR